MFVGNLNFETSQDSIQSLFSQAGEVRDVILPLDRNTGRPRGFAFVEFADDMAAADAIERFNGEPLDGRPLRVNEAEDRRRAPAFSPPPPPPSFAYGKNFGTNKPKGSRRNVRKRKRSL